MFSCKDHVQELHGFNEIDIAIDFCLFTMGDCDGDFHNDPVGFCTLFVAEILPKISKSQSLMQSLTDVLHFRILFRLV